VDNAPDPDLPATPRPRSRWRAVLVVGAAALVLTVAGLLVMIGRAAASQHAASTTSIGVALTTDTAIGAATVLLSLAIVVTSAVVALRLVFPPSTSSRDREPDSQPDADPDPDAEVSVRAESYRRSGRPPGPEATTDGTPGRP